MEFDHQADLREGGHDLPDGAGRAAGGLAVGPVEGEVVEGVQRLQDVQHVAAGVALVQAEQQPQDLVGRVDLQPDQGQQQPAAQVVGVGAAGSGGAAARRAAAAGGGGGLAVAAVVGLELVGQGEELLGGQAGEANEGGGLGGQGFQAQHGIPPQLQAYEAAP